MCEGGGGRSGVALGAGGGGERRPGARGGGGLSRRRSGAGPTRACDCGERGGAGPCALCYLRPTTPPLSSRGGRGFGWAALYWPDKSRVSRVRLRGAAGRGREVCLPLPSRARVGRRGSTERQCHSPWRSSPFPLVSASLASEAGLGKARCPVWLGVAAPRFAPPYVSVGGRGLPTANYGGVRTFSGGSPVPFALGTRARCQSCCL